MHLPYRLNDPKRKRNARPRRNAAGGRLRPALRLESLEQRTVLSALAAVTTDFSDYSPGNTAVITGTGFDSGELVDLTVTGNDPDGEPTINDDLGVFAADADGNLTASYIVPAGDPFTLTATPTSTDSTSPVVTATFHDGSLNFQNVVGATKSGSTLTGSEGTAISFNLNAIPATSGATTISYHFTLDNVDGRIIQAQTDAVTGMTISDISVGNPLQPRGSLIQWTPTESQDGPHSITVRAHATNFSQADITLQVSFIINEVNTQPTLTSPGNQAFNENVASAFDLHATDTDLVYNTVTQAHDPNTLTYSLFSGPAFVSVSSTGHVSVNPGEADDGSYSATFKVSDGKGGSDQKTISLTISEVNTAPTLADPGSKTFNENVASAFDLSATDTDLVYNGVSHVANTLTYSLVTGPAFVSVSNSGHVTLSPGETDDGPYSVTFGVDDGHGGSDQKTISLTISEVNVNPSFGVGSSAPASVVQGVTTTFSNSATDADFVYSGGNHVANHLTYSLVAPVPAGVTIDASTGDVSVTPQSAATLYIHTRVDDGHGGFATKDFTIGVTSYSVVGGVLMVGGSSAGDKIQVTNHGGPQPIIIFINNVRVDNGEVIANTITGIQVDGGDGNDTIWVEPILGQPETIHGGDGADSITAGGGLATIYGGCGNDTIGAGSSAGAVIYGEGDNDSIGGSVYNDVIFGGDGNDTVQGNNGDDVIVGGDGNDLLGGSNGRDVLVGGTGTDSLVGNAGEDILIAGTTDYDAPTGANITALSAIRAFWAGTDPSAADFALRVAGLSTGANGYVGPQLNASTIHDDNAIDVLYGDNTGTTASTDLDWYILNYQGSGAKDLIKDIVDGAELLAELDIS